MSKPAAPDPKTPAERVFARIATTRAASAGAHAHRPLGPTPAAVLGVPAPRTAPPLPGGPTPDAGSSVPRLHLVPTPPTARVARTTTSPGPPPTLTERVERIQVLRADDRSLVLEAPDEDDDTADAPPTTDPTLVVRRLASAGVEVIGGLRPAAQLARWLAPGVLDALRARADLTRHGTLRLTRAPQVRNVRLCTLHEHVVEATAVVDDGSRVRAIAVRLETHRGAWRATALEVG